MSRALLWQCDSLELHLTLVFGAYPVYSECGGSADKRGPRSESQAGVDYARKHSSRQQHAQSAQSARQPDVHTE
jgi:hypothetical protein